MMRLSLMFSALFLTTGVAAADMDLMGIAEDPFFLDASTHYGNPKDGCMPDEHMFRIQGVDGDLCTPQCTPAGKCPADVPDGVTAHPLCGLSTPEGQKYCVLLCSPDGANACGDAKCRTVKGQPGVGICTYDVSEEEEEEGELVGAW